MRCSMFLKITHYFALILLISIAPKTYSASGCKDSFSDAHHATVEIESYRQLLVKLAKSALKVSHLSSKQIEALETYHQVVQGEAGKDGTFARAGNYTFFQKRRIVKFLGEFFSPEEVAALIESKVVEIDRVVTADYKKLLKHIREGKTVFIHDRALLRKGSFSDVLKVKGILEDTRFGFLIDVEAIDYTTGQLISTDYFFVKKSKYIHGNPLVTSPINRILRRTESGFMIKMSVRGEINFISFREAIRRGLLPERPTPQDYHKLESSLYNNGLARGELSVGDIVLLSAVGGYPGNGIKLLSSTVGVLFSAINSTRSRIDSKDLNLPPPVKKETQLAEQGYEPVYTAGLDKISEWFALRKQLQKLRANPYITHIEYFADQIPYHIAHIRKGLEDNYSSKEESQSSKRDQLRKLDALEEEARIAVLESKVTYKWWVEFNEKLSNLMTGTEAIVERDREIIKYIIPQFPLQMLVPTIADIGVMTFNRAGTEGIYPVELINKETIYADGVIYDPYSFFRHDILHASFSGNQIHLDSFGHLLFHKRLLDNIESLSVEKRKKAEAVYFVMTHEYINQNIGQSDRTLQQIRKEVSKAIDNNIARLFKLPREQVKRKQKVNHLTDIFMGAYIRALQHQ